MRRPWNTAGWSRTPWRAVVLTLVVLALHRLGVSVALPGADRAVVQAVLGEGWLGHGLLGLYDLVVGSALGRASVLAVGLIPWLLADTGARVVTAWVERRRAGPEPSARRTASQWTRYASLGIGCVLAVGLSRFLVGLGAIPGGFFGWLAVVSLVAGAALTMFMAEVISRHGVGGGAVVLVWGGLAARIPRMPALLAVAVIVVVTIPLVSVLSRALRRIPIRHARRFADGRVRFAGQATYFPVPLGAAPARVVSLAAAILGMTAVLGTGGDWSNPWLFQGTVVALVLGLSALPAEFAPATIAENVRRQGGYVPGIRPGAQTASYLAGVRNRIGVAGALLVSAGCVIPSLLWPRAAGATGIHFEGIALFLLVSTPIEVLRQASRSRPSPRPGGGPGHGDPPAAPALARETGQELAVGGR
jgi:preprotein translocase subunit SecY